MANAKVPEADFVRLLEEIGPHATAKKLGITFRAVFARRAAIEGRIGRQITCPDHPRSTRANVAHPQRLSLPITNGTVLVGSDAHLWPGIVSTAWRAFEKFARQIKPSALILNGDVMDFASVSRHAPIQWEHKPTVQQEIEFAQERLHELEAATPRSCKLYWTLGNHDARYETRIATIAPEYAKVHGVHLKDHFGSQWQACYSVWINDDVVVKHRFKGGIHATHNNTMWSGKTTVTGHLHSLKVTPFSDYNGTRWGVDTGTLADPYGPQFNEYCEDNPVNWRSGFVVLTIKDGMLLWPEIVYVIDRETVGFRGEIIKV